MPVGYSGFKGWVQGLFGEPILRVWSCFRFANGESSAGLAVIKATIVTADFLLARGSRAHAPHLASLRNAGKHFRFLGTLLRGGAGSDVAHPRQFTVCCGTLASACFIQHGRKLTQRLWETSLDTGARYHTAWFSACVCELRSDMTLVVLD